MDMFELDLLSKGNSLPPGKGYDHHKHGILKHVKHPPPKVWKMTHQAIKYRLCCQHNMVRIDQYANMCEFCGIFAFHRTNWLDTA